MYIYFAHVYMYTYTCLYIHRYAYISLCGYIHIWIYLHIYVYVYMYIYTSIYIHIYKYYLYIYLFINWHVFFSLDACVCVWHDVNMCVTRRTHHHFVRAFIYFGITLPHIPRNILPCNILHCNILPCNAQQYAATHCVSRCRRNLLQHFVSHY